MQKFRTFFSVRTCATLCAVSVTVAVTGLGLSTQAAMAAPSLQAYVSEPFVQGPNVSGVDLETFDTDCPDTWWAGTSNQGTASGTCRSLDANMWGGASSTSGLPDRGDGTNVTKYGAVWEGETLRVTLDHPASYLGFEWFAGDSSNFLTLYSGSDVVGQFTTDDLLAMIYYNNVGSWSSEDYMINPAMGYWIGAPSAYVHLVGIDGLTFDSFEFTQPYYGGFEFDNFALSTDPVTINPATNVAITPQTPPDGDGDGINDVTEDTDGDGIADPFEDNNGDGTSDVLEDSDGDGINDFVELSSLPDTGVATWPTLLLGVFLLTTGGLIVMLRRRRENS